MNSDIFSVACFAHGLRPILCAKQVTGKIPVIAALAVQALEGDYNVSAFKSVLLGNDFIVGNDWRKHYR